MDETSVRIHMSVYVNEGLAFRPCVMHMPPSRSRTFVT